MPDPGYRLQGACTCPVPVRYRYPMRRTATALAASAAGQSRRPGARLKSGLWACVGSGVLSSRYRIWPVPGSHFLSSWCLPTSGYGKMCIACGQCLTHACCHRGACLSSRQARLYVGLEARRQQAGTVNGYCKRGDGIRPASRRRSNVDASRQRRCQRRRGPAATRAPVASGVASGRLVGVGVRWCGGIVLWWHGIWAAAEPWQSPVARQVILSGCLCHAAGLSGHLCKVW